MALALSISAEQYEQLLDHLGASGDEQAAFLFTAPPSAVEPLRVVKVHAVPRAETLEPSPFYLALSDEVRARVIARASSLGGCLVEAHNHPHGPAAFSATDLAGFEEWVPHVRWRLAGRPYIALVLADEEFDALVWQDADGVPEGLDRLDVAGEPLAPTGLTQRRLARKSHVG